MNYSLQILSEAADDIREITFWYKGISPELGRRFVAELYNGFDRIVANPNAWFNIASRVKRYTLSHFPYLIIFQVQNDLIVLYAVIHSRRNPNRWKKRIKL